MFFLKNVQERRCVFYVHNRVAVLLGNAQGGEYVLAEAKNGDKRFKE